MRNVLPALTLAFLCASAAMAAQACSGDSSSSSDLFTDAATSDATLGDDTGTSGTDSGGGVDQSSGHDTGGGETQGDTGAIVLLDGGPDVGPVPCIAGGTLETEPNDNPGEANTLPANQAMCGVITKLDDGGTDSDFFTFQLGQSVNTMNLEFFGNVKLTVTEGSSVTVLSPGSTTPVPFEHDKRYDVQVQSLDGNQQNYRIILHES